MNYANNECNQFVDDVRNAGFKVCHYKGRMCYEGPGVFCERYQYHHIMKITSIKIQHDGMGKGIIVYPIVNGNDPNPKPRFMGGIRKCVL